MNAPKYRVDEILDVTLPGVRVTSVAGAESGEIEVLLECPSGGRYRTDIPLNVAAIRRVTPAGGPPQPGEVWADTDGVERYACRGAAGDVLLRDADNAVAPWQKINVERGPLVRVYSPAGAAPAAPGEPVLTLSDRWKARDGEIWWVATNAAGELRLTLGDRLCTWGEVDGAYGLMLVERAGCRRTANTVPVWQLKIGQVVSYPEWADGAPVRFFSALGDVRDLKITCRPLGWISKTTFPAARDAEVTLWGEIAGGAR